MNKIQETEASPEAPVSGVRPRQDVRSGISPFAANVDAASSSVGRGMGRAGEALESAGRSAGASARSAGQYLQEADAASLRDDFLAAMGKHPGATLAIGVGTGLLLARLLPSRRGRAQ